MKHLHRIDFLLSVILFVSSWMAIAAPEPSLSSPLPAATFLPVLAGVPTYYVASVVALSFFVFRVAFGRISSTESGKRIAMRILGSLFCVTGFAHVLYLY